MRAKAVRLIGERAVGAIEKVVEYVRELITGGPAKLWEKVKEDLGNLKQMVIDAIQDWLITTIIKQAVTKIVSMFNPAGAIVQAVLAIYNVVVFVIEKAQQIMTLVEAVVNSVAAIASGAIGSAIAWIEKSLANAMPLVIGFLAQLLGLGGISRRSRSSSKRSRARWTRRSTRRSPRSSRWSRSCSARAARRTATPTSRRSSSRRKGDHGRRRQVPPGGRRACRSRHRTRRRQARAPGLQDDRLEGRERRGVLVLHRLGQEGDSRQAGQGMGGRHARGATPGRVKKAKGESHHVPQKIMLASMGEFYQAIATPIAKVDKPLADRMRKEGKKRLDLYKKDGIGLSAIWLRKKVHKAAHQPQPLKDVEQQAKKLEDRGQTARHDGRWRRDDRRRRRRRQGRQGTGDDAAGQCLGGRQNTRQRQGERSQRACPAPAPVRCHRQHARQGGTGVGFGRSSSGKRRATAQQIAKAKATNAAEAEKLNVRASALFKAQWNGLLAGGLTGVNAALGKDDGWRTPLIATSQDMGHLSEEP
ncbi:MAG: hypothetical protein V5B44_06800 [Candidatus Accumulibacter necessarius]|jgi:hypothetical protein|uniref:hypothetical protein n=1 Tax=Candidatus Accumulibacter necessarius TaxID=2954386 RepID=UPI002FC30128